MNNNNLFLLFARCSSVSVHVRVKLGINLLVPHDLIILLFKCWIA